MAGDDWNWKPVDAVQNYLDAKAKRVADYQPYEPGPEYQEPTGPLEVTTNAGQEVADMGHGLKAMEALGNARVSDAIPSLGAQAKDWVKFLPPNVRKQAANYDPNNPNSLGLGALNGPASWAMKNTPGISPDFLLRVIKYGDKVNEQDPTQYYKGLPLFREGDAAAVENALFKGFIEDPADKYVHPVLRGDFNTLGRNVGKQPLGTIIDAASVPLPPAKFLRLLPGFTGALKTAKRLEAGLNTAKDAAKLKGLGVLKKAPPMVQDNIQRYLDQRRAAQEMKDLNQMPDDLVSEFMAHRAMINKLHDKIPPEWQKKLAGAMERTALDDPEVVKMLEDPRVQEYIQAVNTITENQAWRASQQLGGFTDEARDATRYVPEVKAKLGSGQIALDEATTPERIKRGMDQRANRTGQPELGIRTKDFSIAAGNEMLQNLLTTLKEIGQPAGTYTPVVKPKELDWYFSQKISSPMTDPRGMEAIQGAQKARAEAAHYRPEVDDVPVAGERGPQNSFDTAKGHIERYELIERALRVKQWFDEKMKSTALSAGTKSEIATKVSDMLMPMLERAGLPQEVMSELEKFRMIEENVPMTQKLRDGISKVLQSEIAGGVYKYGYQAPAAFQRRLSTQFDVFFAPLIATQNAVFIALSQVNGAHSLFNTMLSLKIATNPKAFGHLIPREILEGMPFGSDRNAVMKALNINGTLSNKVTDVSRAVMWANAVQKDMALIKGRAQKNIFLRMAQANTQLEQALRDLAQYKRAQEGGFTGILPATAEGGKSTRGTMGRFGLGNADFGARFKRIEKLTDDILGNYRRNWQGWGRVAKDTILWPEVLLQTLTAGAHLAQHNRLKFKTAKDLAKAVGDYQQGRQPEGFPQSKYAAVDAQADMRTADDWASAAGGIYSDRPAPDGTHNIVPPRGIIGFDMATDLIGGVAHLLAPDVPGYKPGDTDMHMLFKAFLLANSKMPGTEDMRDLSNPALVNVYGRNYNTKRIEDATDDLTTADAQHGVYENANQAAFTIGGLSISPKIWNYLKTLDARITSPEDVIESLILNTGATVPSDVSVPRFIPGADKNTSYRPKSMGDGELEQPNAATIMDLLPGGRRFMPVQAKEKEDPDATTDELNRRLQEKAEQVREYLDQLAQ